MCGGVVCVGKRRQDRTGTSSPFHRAGSRVRTCDRAGRVLQLSPSTIAEAGEADQDWLKKDLVGALKGVGAPSRNGNLSGTARLKMPSFIPADVDVIIVQGNMAFYRVFARSTAITMCVRLKVREVLVIYFLPHGPLSGPQLETQLTQCFGVSKNTGYQLVFGEAHSLSFDDRSYHQFTLQQKLKDDFLVDTLEKLYLAQDIASMTHAFINACVDQQIHTHYQNDHGTLTGCLI